ncbi:MAG TPA: hypothetical protein ENN76_01985 [Euryarchaeota archaeon]|nr:hypothetical protein [Euryarchaeota archaeon]
MKGQLTIPGSALEVMNEFLSDKDNRLINDLHDIIDKHGGIDEVNRKAKENGSFDSLISRLDKKHPDMSKDVQWLMAKKEEGAFINVEDYQKRILKDRFDSTNFDYKNAVTMEISACQYFSFLMAQARQSVEREELMPGRFIRVRNMKEQEADGDLLAMRAAMQVVGASVCETLDTKGTDGSNVHLGGPATITGYFGGVGQPNTHAIKWAKELLYYYTNYGVNEVLNINPGTVFLAYMMYRLGIDIQFKISVFMGNDNPYSVMWTLMMAKMLAKEDGTTPLIGFNFSNSVDNQTILDSNYIRNYFDLGPHVRFEHHITETYRSIVIQPYNRRDELLEIADRVPNISAKHEGGEIAVEEKREKPSDILDYFRPKQEIIDSGQWEDVTMNYLDKHHAIQESAKALTEKGLTFIVARNLHH